MLCDKKFSCVLICITYCVLFTVVNAQDHCTTVKGTAGTCIELDFCPPLRELLKTKTWEDLTHLREASCGYTQIFKQKVCCPPESEWSTLRKTPQFVNPTPIPTLGAPDMTRYADYRGFECPITVKPPKRDSRCCGIETVSTDRIIGGDVASVEQYPWLALLDYANKDTRCGGALISSRYVLTAAHCLLHRLGPPRKVRLAEYDTSTYPTDMVEVSGGGIEYLTVFIIDIESNIVHPNYRANAPSREHDIGLIKLSRNAPYTEFIRPICLPSTDVTKNPTDLRFTVAGWGYNGFKNVDLKMYVEIPYVPLNQCQKSYKQTLTDKQICAGGEKDKDSCTGDSGGPLMYEYPDGSGYMIAGIVSFGQTLCGGEGKPAVYTNVFKYLDWILANMI